MRRRPQQRVGRRTTSSTLSRKSSTSRRRKRQKRNLCFGRVTVSMVFLFVISCGVYVTRNKSSKYANQTQNHKEGARLRGGGSKVGQAQRLTNESKRKAQDNPLLNAAELPLSDSHATNQLFETIVCSDGVTIGYINDDYCDCTEDGRDETETSACSHVLIQQPMFHCGSNLEHQKDTLNQLFGDGKEKHNESTGKVIFASRVGDGIRDCPDGSDERA